MAGETLYEIWNTLRKQNIRTDKIVAGQIVEFDLPANGIVSLLESEVGPTMSKQIDVGRLQIISSTPGQIPAGGSGAIIVQDTLVAGVPKVVVTAGVADADLFQWSLIVKDTAAPNRYASKVFAINDDATGLDFTEFAINEIGTIAVTTNVKIAAGQMELELTSSVDADVKVLYEAV